MTRLAFVCCALVACNNNDKPAPAPATPTPSPTQPSVPLADAAVIVPTTTCFSIPFGFDAERAGIRRLAHHAGHGTAVDNVPAARDVTLLPVGTPTLVPSLHPAAGSPALQIADLGADALTAMARVEGKKVTLTAPAHLEGAVFELEGDGTTLVAVGDAGLATLARYRTAYVRPRIASAAKTPDPIQQITPLALVEDDVDGDGTLELVSLSRVFHRGPPSTGGAGPMRGAAIELGVLWQSGELGYAHWMDVAPRMPALYLAPPGLSGGKPLVFTLAGDRAAIVGKTLGALPVVNPNARKPGADLGEALGDIKNGSTGGTTALAPHVPPPLCLSTSATVEAALVTRP